MRETNQYLILCEHLHFVLVKTLSGTGKNVQLKWAYEEIKMKKGKEGVILLVHVIASLGVCFQSAGSRVQMLSLRLCLPILAFFFFFFGLILHTNTS